MKTRTITIAKADIFADVDATTHVLSNATAGKDLRYADALESDTGDDLSHGMVTRYADRRAAELRERMNRFIATETATTATAALTSAIAYTFALYVEDAFQDELLAPLANAIEEYIATGAIADWYAAVGDPQTGTYAQRLSPIYANILSYIVKRKFPIYNDNDNDQDSVTP